MILTDPHFNREDRSQRWRRIAADVEALPRPLAHLRSWLLISLTSTHPTIGSLSPFLPKRAGRAAAEYPAGATVSLDDLKGRTVVLYFYPKDDTPGCTTQACALRDGWTDI